MAKAWKAMKLGGRQSHNLFESDALPRHSSIPSGQAPEPDPAEPLNYSWVLPHLERGGAEERQVQQGCAGARADPEYSVHTAQVYSRGHKVLTRSHAARPGRKVGGAGVALSPECGGARQSSVRCFVRASRQHGPQSAPSRARIFFHEGAQLNAWSCNLSQVRLTTFHPLRPDNVCSLNSSVIAMA